MSLSYRDKLRDPRWQKKRLEILSRDEFTCVSCGDAKSPVHVHHCFYEKGNEPWDYPDSSLITLCEECHALETEHGYQGKKMLSTVLATKGIRDSVISQFAIEVYSCSTSLPPEIWLDILGTTISKPALAKLLEDNYFAYFAAERSGDAV